MVLFRTHQRTPVCLATVGWLSIEYMEFGSEWTTVFAEQPGAGNSNVYDNSNERTLNFPSLPAPG